MKISTDENLPIYGNAQQQSTVGALRESNSSYKTGISQFSVTVMKHTTKLASYPGSSLDPCSLGMRLTTKYTHSTGMDIHSNHLPACFFAILSARALLFPPAGSLTALTSILQVGDPNSW